MLRKLLFTFTLVLASSVFVFGQAGALKGKVIDAGTKEAIPFANVAVKQGGSMVNGASTDFDGMYMVKPLAPGTYDLEITVIGYANKRIKGVLVSADQTRFLNISMESSDVQLETFTVESFEVPLIDKDNTVSNVTKTAEDIKNMAVRSVGGIVATSGGVISDDGEVGSIRGARTDATVTYIDGIRVLGSSSLPQSAIDQVSLILGGTPAQYGDARGGVINVTTKGASREFGGGLELESSELTDAYGNNRLGFSMMGPIIKGKDKNTAIFGYFLAGDLYYRKDGRPSAFGTWVANDSTLKALRQTPLRPTGELTGGTYRNGEFVRKSDLKLSKITPNTARMGANVSAKLDVKISDNTNLTFGGQYNYATGNYSDFNSSMFNSDRNTEFVNKTWRVFGRFTQRFPTDPNKNSLIKNVYYTIQADYTKIDNKYYDPDFKDDIFKYGYLGSFKVEKESTFEYDDELYMMKLNSWDHDITYELDDATATFNPYIANYTKQIYGLYPDKEGNWENEDQISSNGAFLNGDNSDVNDNHIYGMWTLPGIVQSGYGVTDDDQISANLAAAMDVGNHEVKFGFQFEQRRSSGYSWGGTGLWGLMRREINNQIRELDLNSPYYSATNDTIFYPRRYDASSQYTFDKRLREAMGLEVDGLDFIVTDSYNYIDHTIQYYDKDGNLHTTKFDGFDINMFSPDELINNGNSYASAYGYDVYGNKLSSRPTFDDFFTGKDENGNFTRLIAPFQPIYLAGYVQDKFSFDDLIFNIGLRVDRFDANQPVLKDPFLLRNANTVSEVNELAGVEVSHPENMGADYTVYVDNFKNPTKIVGYRSGTVWYDGDGNEISDPTVLDQGAGINPYISDTTLSSKVFKDYEPQLNFMPRISFSFPISEEALFFAHYDILTQRPTQRLYSNPAVYQYFNTYTKRPISNPDLKPATTIEYEIGFQQKLSKTSSLKINTFYREMKDDIQIYRFNSAYPKSYTSFNNIDFGTVKGATVTYDLRRTNNVRLVASYTLQFAAGTGSNVNTAAALVSAGLPNLRILNPFDYDKRHNINLMVDYRYADGKEYTGPVWTKKNGEVVQLLKNTGINLSINGGSGKPYTAQRNVRSVLVSGVNELEGTINGSRLPWQFRTDMKIDRDIDIKIGENKYLSLNAYILFLNLFDNKNILGVYRATGSPYDDGYLIAPEWQSDIESKINPDSYRDLYSLYLIRPGNFSAPRQIRIGLTINF
jgi:outer membrane receptor protein involved in Fe transport